jgi:peptidoglycan/LPS O-acetylase OafA/YrhL
MAQLHSHRPAVRPRELAVALAGLAAGAGVAALQLASDHQEAKVVWALFAPLVGWSFIGTGLYAARRWPESRTGALMVLLGFAWFLFTLQAADSPLVHTLAMVAAGCGAACSCTSASASRRAG